MCFGLDIDAPVVKMDAAVDSPPGEFCYGSGLVRPCFTSAPTGSTKLTTDIDTDGSACVTPITDVGACVIAAGTIGIDSGVTVHARGSRPLVLVASMSITIAGTLDVSSSVAGTQGAAADVAGCASSTAPTASAGGAGGSFGSKGGDGGVTGGGTAGNTITVSMLRGGCPGQNGGGAGGGAGGHGGGAVDLIAMTSIFISGTVNASGAGGTNAGTMAASGGGGGGAGGYIGLDSASVTNSGTLIANGGGGGEASGTASTGAPGHDPDTTAPFTPAAGGAGGSTYGSDGGSGFAQGSSAQPGSNTCLTPCTTPTDGGGGGGGAGIIHVVPSQTVGGNVSPSAT
jgi:hypothetical protein